VGEGIGLAQTGADHVELVVGRDDVTLAVVSD